MSTRLKFGRVWEFKTARFTVSLEIERRVHYRYDGDDENGETQHALNTGELVAFDSSVIVEMDGVEIASDHLGGSVYYRDTFNEFWTAHRDSDPMNRNCSILRDNHPAGPKVSICHYFPDMVASAISEARRVVKTMRTPPIVRLAA